jgi:hypothetical protein
MSLTVTHRGEFVGTGGHHTIAAIDEAELRAAFGDPVEEDWDKDYGESKILAWTEKTYYGRVRTIGLAVSRGPGGWKLGCTLPLGEVNQGTSRTIVELLCPSVVWQA